MKRLAALTILACLSIHCSSSTATNPGDGGGGGGGGGGATGGGTGGKPGPPPGPWQQQELISLPEVSRVDAQGDLTGDGVDDLVLADVAQTELTILATVTDPTTPAARIDLGQDGWAIRPTRFHGDVNGDGRDDLILRSAWDGELRFFFGPLEGDYTYADADLVITGDSANFIGAAGFIGDVDADGDQDLIVAAPGEPEEACHITPNGTLLFRGPLTAGNLGVEQADLRIYDDLAVEACNGWYLDVGDLDGDGHLDLLLGSRDYTAQVFRGPLPDGDLDHGDAALTLGSEKNRLYIDGTLTTGASGERDLVAGAYREERRGVALLRGPFSESTDTIAAFWEDDAEFGYEPDVQLADLDGDGHSELIFTTLSSVAVAVIGGPLETSAVTRFSEADLHVPGTALPALADVTGDGLPEIITLTDTTAHVFQVSR